MSKSHIVAVYGTLRQGHGNHRLLDNDDVEYLGSWRTENAAWRMVSLGGFPAVVPGEGNISVEVYKVSQPVLQSLDTLEGYPHLYQKTRLETPHGRATMYVMSREAVQHTEHIESGDWNDFTGRGSIEVGL